MPSRDFHHDLTGSRWIRKRDGVHFTVLADPNAPATTNRSIRLRNEATGRAFLATPGGLARKYRPASSSAGAADPADPEETP